MKILTSLFIIVISGTIYLYFQNSASLHKLELKETTSQLNDSKQISDSFSNLDKTKKKELARAFENWPRKQDMLPRETTNHYQGKIEFSDQVPNEHRKQITDMLENPDDKSFRVDYSKNKKFIAGENETDELIPDLEPEQRSGNEQHESDNL